MIELFRAKIKRIFLTCPKTQEVLDLEEEILGTMMDKYDELIKEGYDPKTAYKVALKSLNDFNDVIRELKKQGFIQNRAKIIRQCIFATLTYTMAIILTYLVYSFITFNWKWSWTIIVGGAFAYLIAFFTIAFRFFRARNKNILTSLSLFFATMLSTVAVYLAASFIFMAQGHSIWKFSWILFLIGITVFYITDIIYLWRNKKRLTRKIDLFILSVLLTVTIYLIVSFATGKWSVSWLIFIFALFLLLLTVSIDQLGLIKDINKKSSEKKENEQIGTDVKLLQEKTDEEINPNQNNSNNKD